MKHVLLPVLTLACLAPPEVAAQELTQIKPKATGVSVSGFSWLGGDDGELWGAGDSYRTRFFTDRVAYNPFLTRLEPITRELAFTMTSAGRDDAMVEVGRPFAMNWANKVVTYDRGNVTEVYEVRPDALKQSFVFGNVPAGTGDLVVRGQLTHNMELLEATAQKVVFGASNGSVTIDEVIGYDAVGKRVVGSMLLEGNVFEMRLPESFVQTAVAPITLDPAYSTSVVFASGAEYDPDVCYGGAAEVWLAVWQRNVSANDGDIFGRAFTSTGTDVGVDYGFNTGSGHDAERPRVAYNVFRDRYLIAWASSSSSNNRGIRCRSVSATIGDPSAIYDAASVTDNVDQRDVAIGGNRCPNCAAMCLAWDSGDFVQGRNVSLNAAGEVVSASAMTQLGPGNRDGHVDVTDRTADFPYWLIAFASDSPGSTPGGDNPRSIYATQRNTSMTNILGANSYVQFADGNADNRRYSAPAICGNENHWFVAFEGRTASSGTSKNIYASTLYGSRVNAVSPNLWTAQLIVDNSGDDELPEVAWGHDSVLVTWLNGGNLYFKTVSPTDCQDCESQQSYFLGSGDFTFCRVCSQSSADDEAIGQNELCMAVYSRETTSNDAVVARLYEMVDGNVENLGGGCSNAGLTNVYASCARVGNAEHEASIYDIPSSQAVWLVIGVDRIDAGCNSCTLVVDPFTGVIISGVANSNGVERIGIPIPDDPSLAGMTFYEQWLTNSANGNNCAAVGLDFSDCLKVKIQQ